MATNLETAIAMMTEEEKARARDRINSDQEIPLPTEISYHFPEKERLASVTVYGPVPRKGERVFFRVSGTVRGVELEYDYDGFGTGQWFRNCWVVSWVDYSVRVGGTLKERLLYDTRYRVEVHLKRYWSIRGYYHQWVWRIKNWFRKRENNATQIL